MRVLLAAFLSLGAANVSPTADIGSQVDPCVRSAMAAHEMVGVAAAVVMNGELAYEAGYGIKHRDLGGEVDAHTRFHHGSIGKMHTAAAVMRLVEHGLVAVDDPVTLYVPELQFAPGRWTADQMTVRHLITNSAAIPSFRSATDATLSEWAATLDEVPLLARPGAFFNYSNSNFALAALVVERASGMSFFDYLNTEVFTVAGMDDCSAYPADVMASGNYTYGHADDGQIYAPDAYFYPIEVGSGNAFSSAHDLVTWARLMLDGGGDVLSSSSTAQVQQRQMPRLYAEFGRPHSIGGGYYGYGLFVDDYPDATITRHGGGVPGWVGSVAWIHSEGFALALLANTWPSGSAGLRDAAECVFESVLGVTTPDMSEPSDPATWPRYQGAYDAVFDDGYSFEVLVELSQDTLMITVPDLQNPTQNITRELESVAGSAFLFWTNPSSWWSVTFVTGPGNPPPVRWIRNTRFAGYRRTDPPRRVQGRYTP